MVARVTCVRGAANAHLVQTRWCPRISLSRPRWERRELERMMLAGVPVLADDLAELASTVRALGKALSAGLRRALTSVVYGARMGRSL